MSKKKGKINRFALRKNNGIPIIVPDIISVYYGNKFIPSELQEKKLRIVTAYIDKDDYLTILTKV